jgi:hypothetical protein
MSTGDVGAETLLEQSRLGWAAFVTGDPARQGADVPWADGPPARGLDAAASECVYDLGDGRPCTLMR